MTLSKKLLTLLFILPTLFAAEEDEASQHGPQQNPSQEERPGEERRPRRMPGGFSIVFQTSIPMGMGGLLGGGEDIRCLNPNCQNPLCPARLQRERREQREAASGMHQPVSEGEDAPRQQPRAPGSLLEALLGGGFGFPVRRQPVAEMPAELSERDRSAEHNPPRGEAREGECGCPRCNAIRSLPRQPRAAEAPMGLGGLGGQGLRFFLASIFNAVALVDQIQGGGDQLELRAFGGHEGLENTMDSGKIKAAHDSLLRLKEKSPAWIMTGHQRTVAEVSAFIEQQKAHEAPWILANGKNEKPVFENALRTLSGAARPSDLGHALIQNKPFTQGLTMGQVLSLCWFDIQLLEGSPYYSFPALSSKPKAEDEAPADEDLVDAERPARRGLKRQASRSPETVANVLPPRKRSALSASATPEETAVSFQPYEIAPTPLRISLVKALNDCIEDDDHRVCSVGQAERMILVLQGHDPDVVLDKLEESISVMDLQCQFFASNDGKAFDEETDDFDTWSAAIKEKATATADSVYADDAAKKEKFLKLVEDYIQFSKPDWNQDS